jgi:adenylate cyclase
VSGADKPPDLADALEVLESYLLAEPPSLTRREVAERAGVPFEVAQELWRLLGFPTQSDDDVAFTPADVEALRYSRDLMDLGILSAERQSALVRTWGRSFARLADWQTSLLASVALDSDAEPAETLAQLTQEVLPRVDALQSYVWRRHLVSAASRLLAVETPGSPVADLAVVFVDIVGYTSRSRTLSDSELVEWLEYFESETLLLVVDRGGRIIKNIGDEVLLVVDDVAAAADIALEMTQRGEDGDDRFPRVRAGLAYGEVVNRLGDVFGPTVNVAARLTSVARPGTVVIDQGAHEALSGRTHDDGDASAGADEAAYSFRRIRRVSVKGYPRLPAWALRRPAAADGG